MGGNILLVAELSVGEETAREMAPSAFELTVVAPGSSEYTAEICLPSNPQGNDCCRFRRRSSCLRAKFFVKPDVRHAIAAA